MKRFPRLRSGLLPVATAALVAAHGSLVPLLAAAAPRPAGQATPAPPPAKLLVGPAAIKDAVAACQKFLAESGLKPGAEAAKTLEAGRNALAKGDFTAARDLYKEALDVAGKVGDRPGELAALYHAALLFMLVEKPDVASLLLQSMREVLAETNSDWARARVATELGQVHYREKEYEKAREVLEEARTLWIKLKNTAERATVTNNLAASLLLLKQNDRALEMTREAATLSRSIGDVSGEALALQNLGYIHDVMGNAGEALKHLRQSAARYDEAGDAPGAADSLRMAGDALVQGGDAGGGIELFEAALARAAKAADGRREATLRSRAGSAYASLSQLDKALEYHEKALALYRAQQRKGEEAQCLVDLGVVQSGLGQKQTALALMAQALPLLRETGDKSTEARALSSIGAVRADLNERPEALRCLREALELRRQIGDRRGEARTLSGIAGVLSETGQSAEAVRSLEQAIPIHRETHDRRFEGVARMNLGTIYGEMGKAKEARENYDQALVIAREFGDRFTESEVLKFLGNQEEAAGRLPEAEQRYRSAVDLRESARASLSHLSAETRRAFLNERMDVYQLHLRVLLAQNRPGDALEAAQRTKARVLLDLMDGGRVNLAGRLTPEEREQERVLRVKCDTLSATLLKTALAGGADVKPKVDALRTDLARAEQERDTLTDRIYGRYPDLAARRAARTVTAAELGAVLPPDSLLLEYALLEQNGADETVLFAVTTDSAGKALVESHRIRVGRADLAARVSGFRRACGDPKSDFAAYERQARELYGLLLGPVAGRLAEKKRVIVCPDGPLWDAPFAALVSPSGEPLLAAQEVAYAYSATGLRAALQQSGGSGGVASLKDASLLVMADPDFGKGAAAQSQLPPLPGTRREADALRRAFPNAKVFTGKEARESVALTLAPQYRVLHFATHGIPNDAAPLQSSVALAAPPPGASEDGLLTARELFGLDLSKVSLTVLSACDTARGRKQTGEGVVGLSWALFAAGCPTQVLSQWAVDDAATATLMERFYGGLAKGGAKGTSLRDAALSLRKESAWRHPAYWASFVLIGDWR